jgi:hypothetical protein
LTDAIDAAGVRAGLTLFADYLREVRRTRDGQPVGVVADASAVKRLAVHGADVGSRAGRSLRCRLLALRAAARRPNADTKF